MKRLFNLCALMLLIFSTKAQYTIVGSPQVTPTFECAGITINLTPTQQTKIQNKVDALQKNNRYFRLSVERADAFLPIVERIFKEEGVPDDLKYLVVQESNLVSDVVSSSNAVGYWQFKKETAWDVALRVDELVDERLHIVSSSRGAAKYLKRNNNVLNNWVHTVLSYYAGLTGAKSVVGTSGYGLTEMTLDTTCHAYVTTFLSYKWAYQDAIHRNPSPTLSIVEHEDCEGKSLEQLATETNTHIDDLRFFNKWLRASPYVPTDRNYVVIVPKKSGESLPYMAMNPAPLANVVKELKPYKKTYLWGLITVEDHTGQKLESNEPLLFSWNGLKAIMAKKGDNAAKLAAQADLDEEDFLAYNDMKSFDQITLGQVYYVESKNRKAPVPYHTVQDGQTLWEVSQLYGIQLKHLMRKNNIATLEKPKPGRVLWMRQSLPEGAPVEYKPVKTRELVPQPQPTEPLFAKRTTTLAPAERKNAIAESASASAKVTPIILPAPAELVPTENKSQPSTPVVVEEDTTEELEDSTLIATQLQTGETLFALSRRLGMSLDSLMAWNDNFKDGFSPAMKVYYRDTPLASNQIQKAEIVKQVITKADVIVPVTAPKPAPVAVPSVTPSKAIEPNALPTGPDLKAKSHIVYAGETMFKIAKMYGVTVADLMQLNAKADTSIKLGESLKIREE